MAMALADLSMRSTHFADVSIFLEKIDMFCAYVDAFDTSAHQLGKQGIVHVVDLPSLLCRTQHAQISQHLEIG